MSRTKPLKHLAELSDAELRSSIRSCKTQELNAPYAKGRRSWKQARIAAEAELASRSEHFANPS